jgi:hypothetical protein
VRGIAAPRQRGVDAEAVVVLLLDRLGRATGHEHEHREDGGGARPSLHHHHGNRPRNRDPVFDVLLGER